jgi:gliding motility-associated-like protein
MKKILLSILFSLTLMVSIAAHLAGGYIRYDCLGGNNYEIELVIYRDCNHSTGFDNPTRITIFDANGQTVQTISVFTTDMELETIEFESEDPCVGTPENVCIEKGTFTTTVNLPPAFGGYYAVYQRCCRAGNVLNLVNSSETGSSYLTHIPGPDLVGFGNCNSSPVLDVIPDIGFCTNNGANFQLAALDPADGDSLAYHLCEIYTGGTMFSPYPNPFTPPPYDVVLFDEEAGYTYDNPVNDGEVEFFIDPVTGELDFFTPQTGFYAAQFCIEEWRDGVQIGTLRFEVQFFGVVCPQPEASINELTEDQLCAGFEVAFTHDSFLPTESPTFLWDFGVEGDDNATSTEEFPTFTFPGPGFYDVTLIVLPGEQCSDTLTQTIPVFPLLEPDIEMPLSACVGEEIDFFAAGSYTADAEFDWEFSGASIEGSNVENPTSISFQSAGFFPVILTISENNCERSASLMLQVFDLPVANFEANITETCPPGFIEFSSLSQTFNAEHYIEWFANDIYLGQGSTLNQEFTETGFYDIKAVLHSTSNCIATDTLQLTDYIRVFPVPSAEFSLTPGRVVEIEDSNFSFKVLEDNLDCIFTIGGNIFESCNFSFQPDDAGIYPLHLSVINEFGCENTTEIDLVVNGILLYVPNAFSPNGDGVNDVFKPVVVGANNYTLQVFDRWGNLIFETNDVNQGWDGDSATDAQVYNYKILVTNFLNQETLKMGSITVLK